MTDHNDICMSKAVLERITALEGNSEAQTKKISALEASNRSLKDEMEEGKKKSLEEVGAMKKRLEETEALVKEQDQKIERLEAKLRAGDPEERVGSTSLTTTASEQRPSEPLLPCKYVRTWRGVFFLGAIVPGIQGLLSTVEGDSRMFAVQITFTFAGVVCAIAAAAGDPKNFGKRKEKAFIGCVC